MKIIAVHRVAIVVALIYGVYNIVMGFRDLPVGLKGPIEEIVFGFVLVALVLSSTGLSKK